MSEECKIMWLPMAVSGAALAVGLAGIVLTGEWKLLLVLAAATGLSEAIGLINFKDALKDTREEFEQRKADLAGTDPGGVDGFGLKGDCFCEIRSAAGVDQTVSVWQKRSDPLASHRPFV